MLRKSGVLEAGSKEGVVATFSEGGALLALLAILFTAYNTATCMGVVGTLAIQVTVRAFLANNTGKGP